MKREEKRKIIRKIIHNILREKDGLTLTGLYKEIKNYQKRIGIKTLKEIIFDDPNIKVIFHSKTNKDKDFLSLKSCIICGNKELVNIFERDLKGGSHIIAKKCKRCGMIYKGNKTSIRCYEIFLVS